MNRARHTDDQREIDKDRRLELRLIPYALAAIAVIGLMIAVREVFFV